MLKDEQKRAAYDRYGRSAFNGGAGGAGAGGFGGFGGFDASQFGDMGEYFLRDFSAEDTPAAPDRISRCSAVKI